MVTVALVVVVCVGALLWVNHQAVKTIERVVERNAELQLQFQRGVAASVSSTSRAVGEAVQTALAPAPVTRTYTEQDVARELYEQGALPTFNDPTDDSDPTDRYVMPDSREDVATNVSPNEVAKFGGLPPAVDVMPDNVFQLPPQL